MRLEGKTAIVVGAGQTPGETIGNGRATAILFAREGAKVMLVDRRLESAQETEAAIAEEGGEGQVFFTPDHSMPRRAVFINYDRRDRERVRTIVRQLEAFEIETWMDEKERDLPPGSPWRSVIRRAIDNSDAFMAFVSGTTTQKDDGFLWQEIEWAVERSVSMPEDRKYLLAVILDDSVKESTRLPAKFKERNYVKLTGGKLSKEFLRQLRVEIRRVRTRKN